jgi:hypothetical protein
MITKNKFEDKYGRKGGVGMLINMINSCRRRKEIAEYFGVTEDRVRQWCDDMGLEKPNYHRCMTIKQMVEVMEEKGIDEVEKLFSKSRWYEAGLEAINKKHA